MTWGARRALFAIGVIVALASCDSASETSSSARPQTTPVQGAMPAISALPPGSADRPLQPGQSGTQYTPDGLPALLPAKGINADMLFAEKIKDEDRRFDRLENAVADLRREFEAVKPAIVRLAAVEGDMQDLIAQLQTLTGAPPPPAAPVSIDSPLPIPDLGPMPEAMSAELTERETPAASLPPRTEALPPARAEIPQAQAPPATAHATPAGGAMITGVRTGKHAESARIVLDVSARTPFTYNVDNTERVLLIELPEAGWSGAKIKTIENSPLLSSWTAEASGRGHVLAVQLKDKAAVTSASTLENPPRIVFDIKAGP